MAYESLPAGNIGDQFTAELYNQIRDNLDFLRTAPQATYQWSGGSIGTTSTSFDYIPGMDLSITTSGNPILIMLNARINGTTVRLDLEVNGSQLSSDTDGLGAPGANGEVSLIRIVSLAAGTHTVKAMWKVTSSTGTIYAPSYPQFHVRELN